MCTLLAAPRPRNENRPMSKQLTVSASIAALCMAFFALAATHLGVAHESALARGGSSLIGLTAGR